MISDVAFSTVRWVSACDFLFVVKPRKKGIRKEAVEEHLSQSQPFRLTRKNSP